MTDDWDRAALALRLLAIDPAGLGGAVVRMRAGPARDAVIAALPLPFRKISPGISQEQLNGGLDLSATLESGQVVENIGLFGHMAPILLTMAETCGAELAAMLAGALDQSLIAGFVALDEGADADEACPAPLVDRLAFRIAPEGRLPTDWAPVPAGTHAPVPAGTVRVTDAQIETLVHLAQQFGIASLRAPSLALATARAHAAIHGRTAITDADLEAAAILVYAHRATRAPQDDTQTDPPPAPPPDADPAQSNGEDTPLPDGDMLVDAVRAILPADVLAGLVPAGTTRAASGSGAGQSRISNRKGRPLPSRPGRLDSRARIDLVATLRAAAPWQPMRRAQQPERTGLLIRPSDIRLKRYAKLSDRLLIFAVDASGSAALARLNETKGAIELLMGEAYAQRDHVALIAFRGTDADQLLPPTRSLVQTKRRLAALPGGGGTPLAAGLRDAALLARQARQRGLTPTIVLLTDGRGNVALDGQPDRARATADAEDMARMIRREGIAATVIDTGQRPQRALQTLAEALSARYVALPRADAPKITKAVSATLSEG